MILQTSCYCLVKIIFQNSVINLTDKGNVEDILKKAGLFLKLDGIRKPLNSWGISGESKLTIDGDDF